MGRVFEGSAVFLYCWSGACFFSCRGEKYGCSAGIVHNGVGVCCIVGAVLDLADERAAGWGGDALFVVIECVCVWRHCGSDPSLYACGSGAYGVERALVLERLGVLSHFWIYLWFYL
ncbi:hypothetical protein ACRPOS_007260 [Bartonella heixiaziensis]|uniref:hypothetical protein n=1 Tax=Bartonella heixiaziensis TaxID=1461000 RepID=UPI00390888B2